MVERVVTKYSSFQEAEAAEREYYARLTPAERLKILLELIQRYRESIHAPEGFARVYRIVEFKRR